MSRSLMYSRIVLVIAAVALVLFASASPASAQRIRQTPKDRAQHLKDILSLTDDQTAAVQAIYEKSDTDLKSAADDAKATGKSRRNIMREINARTQASINQLLTDDQRGKLADFNKKRSESQPRPSRRPQN